MGEEFRDEQQLEIENRIRNLIWTVCKDYSLKAKPDVKMYFLSKPIALYDGIRQGAFAKYFDKEEVSLYLIKKIYCGASEADLMIVAHLCMESAVYRLIVGERPGIQEIAQKAAEDILELEFEKLIKYPAGRLKAAFYRNYLTGIEPAGAQLAGALQEMRKLEKGADTGAIVRTIDEIYNQVVDRSFIKNKGSLAQVLAVTLEELSQNDWNEFLTEEMNEESLQEYLEAAAESRSLSGMEPSRKDHGSGGAKIRLVTHKMRDKVYQYVEQNFGKTYLPPLEEKKINYRICKGIHGACKVYFTDGILQNPVSRNYQLEYAKKQKAKNKYVYYDKHRVVKQNIRYLTEILRKAMYLRDQEDPVLSDCGNLVPSLVWKNGRSRDTRMFARSLKGDVKDFVVDILIDASGSQRVRQEEVALQAYIISEALSNVKIPHRVMSFCTFWDYTILQRFREYEEDRSANDRLFEFTTSSNNRDGLAFLAAAEGLLNRQEERKILIVLSDGRPYDVVLNRTDAENVKPYKGKTAVEDTARVVRKLRNQDVRVLGIFVGEEKDLESEKCIFGKDFAYIRTISKFSGTVGRYLTKQLCENC